MVVTEAVLKIDKILCEMRFEIMNEVECVDKDTV